MNRRDFSRALFGFSAATLFRSVADSSDSEIAALYNRRMVMDFFAASMHPALLPQPCWLTQPAVRDYSYQ